MSIRRWFFAILAVLSLTAQNAAPSVFKVQDRYTKLEQYINMRDGVKLFTSIYLPKDTSVNHPILFQRTPYSVAPYGPDTFRPSV